MKPIGESAEVFEAYARIDYCYFMIEQLSIDREKKNTSSIEMAIDIATGAFKDREQKSRISAIELIKEVISSKKIIEADYSSDEEFLKQLESL